MNGNIIRLNNNMKILLIIAMVIIIQLAFISCGSLSFKYVKESEVIGSYVTNYEIPLDSLELLSDGRCIHVFQLENQEKQTDTTSWEYHILNSKDGSITSHINFPNLLYVFDDLHTVPLPVNKIKRINIMIEISKKVWNGKDLGIYMYQDPDGAYYYKKVN